VNISEAYRLAADNRLGAMAASKHRIVPSLGSVVQETEPRHQALRDLHAYWLAKKGTRIAPPRSAIQPEEIVPLLPNLALVNVIGDPPRFRFRLFGTALAAAYGQDLTGKFFDEVDLDLVSEEILRGAAEVVRDCCISVVRSRFTKHRDGRHVEYERITLPLSDDGRTVNMLLCGYAVEKAY
jgi:hypothetical protein